jgi:mannose-6-phosphate isomerase-like protein (cupin superfamily)
MASFDLKRSVAALYRDGSSEVLELPAGGPPVRVDGFSVGAAHMSENPPHRGELHPDGDELLYLVSGRVEVILEDGGTPTTVGGERVVEVGAGEAFIVPQGVWHRLNILEPCHLVNVTPGPGDGHRHL